MSMAIRLAFRVEGHWWVAYLAKEGTMDDAREMGRILMGIVLNPERKEAFMALMKLALADAIKDAGIFSPVVWQTNPAPESERAGSA